MAVVGTGNIARIHVEALRGLDGQANIVAAVDIDGDRVARFCADARDPLRGHGSGPDAGGRPPGPGPRLHAARSASGPGPGRAGRRGTRPGREAADAHAARLDELDAAQGDGGPYVATVFQHRFGSGARRLRAMLDDGVLGRPLLAICHTTWYRPQEYFDLPWRGRWETEGGGPTMGHGIHQMDLLLAILGDWTRGVRARPPAGPADVETEDVSLAHVTFASGAVASVVNSVLSPREESYLRFDFERATVELTHLYGYGDDDWRITPAPGHEDAVLTAWKAGEHGRGSGHRAQFAEVLASLRAGAPPPVDIAATRATCDSSRGCTRRRSPAGRSAAASSAPDRPSTNGCRAPARPGRTAHDCSEPALTGLGVVHEQGRSVRVDVVRQRALPVRVHAVGPAGGGAPAVPAPGPHARRAARQPVPAARSRVAQGRLAVVEQRRSGEFLGRPHLPARPRRLRATRQRRHAGARRLRPAVGRGRALHLAQRLHLDHRVRRHGPHRAAPDDRHRPPGTGRVAARLRDRAAQRQRRADPRSAARPPRAVRRRVQRPVLARPALVQRRGRAHAGRDGRGRPERDPRRRGWRSSAGTTAPAGPRPCCSPTTRATRPTRPSGSCAARSTR